MSFLNLSMNMQPPVIRQMFWGALGRWEDVIGRLCSVPQNPFDGVCVYKIRSLGLFTSDHESRFSNGFWTDLPNAGLLSNKLDPMQSSSSPSHTHHTWQDWLALNSRQRWIIDVYNAFWTCEVTAIAGWQLLRTEQQKREAECIRKRWSESGLPVALFFGTISGHRGLIRSLGPWSPRSFDRKQQHTNKAVALSTVPTCNNINKWIRINSDNSPPSEFCVINFP